MVLLLKPLLLQAVVAGLKDILTGNCLKGDSVNGAAQIGGEKASHAKDAAGEATALQSTSDADIKLAIADKQ